MRASFGSTSSTFRRQPMTAVQRRRLGVALIIVLVALIAVGRAMSVNTHGATLTHFTIYSRSVGHAQRITLIAPPGGGQARPLLVLLHGRSAGDDGEDANVNDAFFAALRAQGSRAPDVVMPNGGVASYWHKRATGNWDAYVMDEVIPVALRRLHADPRRIAIGGISMGGFGALDIARHHPGRFCAVGAHSPALWRSGGETAPGAFDDAQDFARNDIVALATHHPSPWGHAKLWLDAGTADPFDPGDRAFIAALRGAGTAITVHRWPGGHTDAYWQAHYRDYLRFYASALAHC
jgi:S-formylglutathione hydrolase FrmB